MHYALKDLTIDLEARTVRREGNEVPLPELSFDLLVALLREAPNAVSNDRLAREVWQLDHVRTETIAQRVALLRKALSDDPKAPRYIRTVRGRGYAAFGPSPAATRPATRAMVWRQGFTPILAGAVVLLLVAVGIALMPRPAGDTMGEVHAVSPVELLTVRARENLGGHRAAETERAVAMLREALKREPAHFDARLTLSFALSTLATKFDGDEDDEREAEALARVLIQERPNSSNAYSALGYALGAQGRLTESLAALERAYDLDPQNAPAASSAAHTLMLLGRLHEALLLDMHARQNGGTSRYAEIQIATVLDLLGLPEAENWRRLAISANPGQVVVVAESARMHLRRGNPQLALDVLDAADDAEREAPRLAYLRGRAMLALGKNVEARGAFLAAGDYAVTDLAALNALDGSEAGTRELFERKLPRLGDNPDPEARVQLAELAAALGLQDEAHMLVAEAVNLGWRDVGWLRNSPFLSDLRRSDEWMEPMVRIERELAAQRQLLTANEEWMEMLQAGYPGETD